MTLFASKKPLNIDLLQIVNYFGFSRNFIVDYAAVQ